MWECGVKGARDGPWGGVRPCARSAAKLRQGLMSIRLSKQEGSRREMEESSCQGRWQPACGNNPLLLPCFSCTVCLATC